MHMLIDINVDMRGASRGTFHPCPCHEGGVGEAEDTSGEERRRSLESQLMLRSWIFPLSVTERRSIILCLEQGMRCRL